MRTQEMIEELKKWMPNFFGVVSSDMFLNHSIFDIEQIRSSDRHDELVLDRQLFLVLKSMEVGSIKAAKHINRSHCNSSASLRKIYGYYDQGNYVKSRILRHFDSEDSSIENNRIELPLSLRRLQLYLNGKSIQTIKILK
tara:strand:+ start:44 stop:463 length:420 start_codon:yes stop_codon:yes gene_type:complete